MGRSALLVLICAATAGAQNVVAPVALMQCRQPEYTEEARLAHLAGIVIMSLTVDDNGVPADIQVVNPVGLGLDESAVACMRQSRYSPAQKDGKPVPLKISVSLAFQQHWDSDWHLGAASFHCSDGGARPVLVKTKFPSSTGDHRNVTVCLHLTIGKNGAPRDVQISAPQDARLDKEAAAIVGSWLFRPGTQNRQPVDVPATFTLVHGAANRAVASSHQPQ
jgi:TonB family protein